ncbi:polysaccharide biosynthesis tyrosine autokinase [Paractinoplanes rishiriensis]|uniref:Polysaccharide chain length determinant N-terminal domain-containing protein n=1 Tax=Paractinoplanes rishiriensis TaxID=1050105 RepID=A0A919MZE7_9ACTN|nr:polysaccharide biosynthesis tyrosine autokinase [Actinoplanes rishiriensis]GIF01424.1 hypothetical protein Ari01nite_88880 [Actinoplanes rishiriensis]
MTTGWGPPRFVRVYGGWIALVTAVVIATALGAGFLLPREYESSATVLVESRVRANTTPVAPDMGTEKQLAQSGLVLGPAAKLLLTTEDDLLDGLSVSVAPDANVLTFRYRHGSAAEAQRRAEVLSGAYVKFRNAEEAAAPTATQHAVLVTGATAPGDPVSHPIVIYLGAGLIAGLLLGVGTALLRDKMSDRVRGSDDFARISGVPVLATVPRLPAKPDDPRALLLQPMSPAAESFRYLRSRLQPLLRGTGVVLVTSAEEGEGRTMTAANLAVVVAQAGHDVVLIDGDLRNPRLHQVFDRNSPVGLSGVLGGRHSVEEGLVPTAVPGLTLLPAGPLPGNAGDLLYGDRLRWVLDVARAHADVVILDSPAVLSVSDSITLAAAADHVLLVGNHRRTTRTAVARMLAELNDVARGGMSTVLLDVPRGDGGPAPQGPAPQGLAPQGQPPVARPAPMPAPMPAASRGLAASLADFPTAGMRANNWEPPLPPATFEPPLREPMPTLYRTPYGDN